VKEKRNKASKKLLLFHKEVASDSHKLERRVEEERRREKGRKRIEWSRRREGGSRVPILSPKKRKIW
jgi:hypothetical protein